MKPHDVIGKWTVLNACPGSGKTTFAAQAALACADEYGPERVAVVTYTVRAALHITEVLNAHGNRNWGYIGTLHGLALRLVNENRVNCGFVPLSVMAGDAEQNQLKEVAARYKVTACAIRQGLMKSCGDPKVARAVNDIRQRRMDDAVITYDEMVLAANALLKNELVEPGLDALIIDEVQDASEQDLQFYVHLPAATKLAVGDSHQSIFQFRGGLDDALERLAGSKYGSSKWKQARLSKSWRCPQVVAEAVRSIGATQFECHRTDVGKMRVVFNRREVANLIKEEMTRNPSWSCAVICRTNALADAYAEYLAEPLPLYIKLNRHRSQSTDAAAEDIRTMLGALLNRNSRAHVEAAARITLKTLDYELSLPDLCNELSMPGADDVVDVRSWIMYHIRGIERTVAWAMVNTYTSVHEMLAMLTGASGPPEGEGQRVDVLTVHAAKGGEWSLVIAPNWGDRRTSVVDTNLDYVTITRTKEMFVPVKPV